MVGLKEGTGLVKNTTGEEQDQLNGRRLSGQTAGGGACVEGRGPDWT